MTNILLLVMPIAGAMLLALGIFQVIMDLRTAKARKVVDRLTESRTGRKGAEVKESLLRKRAADLQGGALEGVVAKFQIVTKLQRVLDQADVNWSASRLLVNLAGVGLALGVTLLVLGASPVSALSVGSGVVGLPLIWLIRKRKKRIRKLVEQLPDVFDLMGQALRAGHSLPSAIQLVSEQVREPIGSEFARVFQEQNMGIKVEEALSNMGDRTDQMDVRFFVTAVLIQRQTGGDLAEVLDKISSVIRGRIELMGQVQALTAEGRLSGWVLLALPVVMFIAMLFLNREYANELINTETGRLMLGIAVALDLVGLALIRKIVNIKV